jgi:hypothetical protein
LGGGGGAKKPEATKLEKLVLEITVQEPGAEPQVHARILLAPPREGERFRALPILQASFLVSPALLPPGERPRRELSVLAQNSGAIRKFLKGQWEGIRFNPELEVSGLLLRYDEFRRRALARLLGGAPFLQDRVGLFAETRQLFVDDSAKVGKVRRGIDILSNPVAILDAAGNLDPQRAIQMGVVDTALEALLVAREAPGETSLSAWTLIERARLRQVKPEILQAPDGRRLIRWSNAAMWSVDVATGNSVGRVPSGEGQALVEYIWEHKEQICAASTLYNNFITAEIGPEDLRHAGEWLSRACAFLEGKNIPDYLKDKIIEMNKEYWAAASNALAGVEGGE